MIYTTYFANIRNLPKNCLPIAICQWPPKWYHGAVDKRFAPSSAMLQTYKQTGDVERFKTEYEAFILGTSATWKSQIYDFLFNTWMYGHDGTSIALVCYEKPTDFCHRHILADKFRELGFECREFNKEIDLC